ncbi:hypothetical protein SNE26_17540 [Mucilaginibacter sp. cycad4]|uniref:hypothetical protein n=1 Tax=Mucilaginibacter sp. cycad4 TaxID=3342096 RepID=UPI002AAAD185|nr:hypothetical protein [Mucilaginibacter gossypii]WPU97832.1 hypothetical protein SNE26_17540 [Mucilaginibacter gossypii]
MLHQFTWQQFLVAAVVFSCIWYLVVGFSYRKQFDEFLKRRRRDGKQPEPLQHAWNEDYEEFSEDEASDLMGKTVLPKGVSQLGMNMFGFAPDVSEKDKGHNWDEQEDLNNEIKDDDHRQVQQSLIPDVIEELKSIFHILEKEQGSKPDFISLFGLVKAKYPAIKGTANQQALNDYIRDNVLFPISDKELDSLWA